MPEQAAGLMRGFQLWVNLPATDKMCAPRYQDVAPERVPLAEPAAGVRVRVIAGRCGQIEGPVRTVVTEPVYLDVRLDAQAGFAARLPRGHQAFAYVYAGSARVGGAARPVGQGELAVLTEGDAVELSAQAMPARLLLVAGRPLREPVARYGPFVMNTREQVIEAIEDFQAGRIAG